MRTDLQLKASYGSSPPCTPLSSHAHAILSLWHRTTSEMHDQARFCLLAVCLPFEILQTRNTASERNGWLNVYESAQAQTVRAGVKNPCVLHGTSELVRVNSRVFYSCSRKKRHMTVTTLSLLQKKSEDLSFSRNRRKCRCTCNTIKIRSHGVM